MNFIKNNTHLKKLNSYSKNFPHPIAYNIHDFLVMGNFESLVFEVEAILRYTTLIVKSLYLKPECPVNEKINLELQKVMTLPSMGKWLNFLKNINKIKDEAAFPILMDDLEHFFHTFDLKKFDPFVSLRNHRLGHPGRLLDQNEKEELIETYWDRFIEILDAISFWRKYNLLVIKSEEDGFINAMGTSNFDTVTDSSGLEIQSPMTLLSANGQVWPIFPLLISVFEGFQSDNPKNISSPVLLFDGADISAKRIVYMGTYGRGFGKRWFKAYQALIRSKNIPMTPLDFDNVDDLKSRFDQSLKYVFRSNRENDPDFLPGLIRYDVSIFNNIQLMTESSARLLIVSGNAGTGKTSNCIKAALDLSEAGSLVLFVQAAGIIDKPESGFKHILSTIFTRYLSILFTRKSYAEDLQNLCKFENKRMIIFLDGLDEIGSAKQIKVLLSGLYEFLRGPFKSFSLFSIILTVRSAYLDDAKLRDKLDKMGSEIFHPDVNQPFKGFTPGNYLEIPSPAKKEVEARFEHFREHSSQHQSSTSFQSLPISLKNACKNPRWMMNLLRIFNGKNINNKVTPYQLWIDYARKYIYQIIEKGGKPIPLWRSRAVVMDFIIKIQLEKDSAEIELDQIMEMINKSPNKKNIAMRDALTELESLNFFTTVVKGEDCFSSPIIVRFFDHSLISALHFLGPVLRLADIDKLLALDQDLKNTKIEEIVRRAIALKLFEIFDPKDVSFSTISSFSDRVVSDFIILLSAIEKKDKNQILSKLLFELAQKHRNMIFKNIDRSLRFSDDYSNFIPCAEEIITNQAFFHTVETVLFIANIFKSSGLSKNLLNWLEKLIVQQNNPDKEILYLVADIYRSRGQWVKAVNAYDNIISSAESRNIVQIKAIIGKTESLAWLDKHDAAIELLNSLDDETLLKMSWDLKFKYFVKLGIILRISGTLIKAYKNFEQALQISRQYNYSRGNGTALLERSLVAAEFGDFEQAVSDIDHTISIFIETQYIRGLKKAYYCRGYINEKMLNITSAIKSYTRSLKLNEEYFDELGVYLNHSALARILPDDNTEKLQHLAKKQKYSKKLNFSKGDEQHASLVSKL